MSHRSSTRSVQQPCLVRWWGCVVSIWGEHWRVTNFPLNDFLCVLSRWVKRTRWRYHHPNHDKFQSIQFRTRHYDIDSVITADTAKILPRWSFCFIRSAQLRSSSEAQLPTKNNYVLHLALRDDIGLPIKKYFWSTHILRGEELGINSLLSISGDNNIFCPGQRTGTRKIGKKQRNG